jgi:hypothetical protein
MSLYRNAIIRPPWHPQPARTASAHAPQLLINQTYYTTFPNTENPTSEGGLWLSGRSNGFNMNMRSTPGKVFGTQDGNGDGGSIFDDSIAFLRGAWGLDQYARATVFNTRSAGDWNTEVELHLRGNMTRGEAFTYEVEYSCRADNAYFDLTKWDSTIAGGSFNLSHVASMPGGAAVTGDVVEASITGNTINAWKNGVLIASVTDSLGLSGSPPFTTGTPGIGHFLHNITATGDPTQYGFSDFLAAPLLSIGDPENYGRPSGLHGQVQLQQLLAI